MRDRHLVSLITVAGVLGLASFAAVPMIAQAPSTAKPATAKPTPAVAATQSKPGAAAQAKAIPRTPWGQPDLQGTWFVTEDVPLERSAANAGREFLTDEEVAAADKQKAANQGRNTRAGNAAQDVGGAYNAVFNSVLKTGKRTSRIIDPPDGRIPPTVAGGEAGGRGGRGGRGNAGGGTQGDGPETVGGGTRCLGVQTPFLPLNTAFAQGTVMQVVQSPNSVAIYMEDDHAGGGNRVIHVDGRPHPPSNVKLDLGDSRGRWEGNALVVETTNFSQGFRGSNAESFKMIERFTRVDARSLRREITFDDAKTWTRPWTVLIELGKVADERHMIFESACHEGNYGLTGILVGARADDRALAAKPGK
jgi:hypothetical protein